MQPILSRPDANFNNRGNNRTQIILIVALALFSFSGMAVGFATGAFAHLNQALQTTPTPVTSPIAHNSPIAAQTQTPQTVPLGCPIITSNTPTGIATYSFSVQVVDNSQNPCNPPHYGNPIRSDGITCKLWLSSAPPDSAKLLSQLKQNGMNALQQPLPGEMQDEAISFTPPMTQVQQTDNQGRVTWTFQAPTIKPDKYYVVILTDWNGKSVNWSWFGPIPFKGLG